MKKTFVIHPFLFTIFPILFLLSHNIDQMSFAEILVSIEIALSFTLLLILLLWSVLRDNQKAGIVVSSFLILFFENLPNNSCDNKMNINTIPMNNPIKKLIILFT